MANDENKNSEMCCYSDKVLYCKLLLAPDLVQMGLNLIKY